MELLYYKDFEEINVEEICQKASISRSTFYRYFESKEHRSFNKKLQYKKEPELSSFNR